MDRHGVSSSAGVGAPYGHACVDCALSKCKCIVRRAGGPCERCHRMNKTCRPAETTRRRTIKKRAPSKITRMEEKLDGLVSLIRAGVQAGSVVKSPALTVGTSDGTYHLDGMPTRSPSEDNSVSSRSNEYINSTPTPVTSESTGSLYNIVPSAGHEAWDFTASEATDCLRNFRAFKLKYFPCVYIPPETTTHQLQQEKPLLWLCIMRLGSKSTSRQQLIGKKIRQMIAEAMVIESEKNLDLLLGLLVYMGWANYQLFGRPFLTLFSQLATSLVYDLGLNKPISPGPEIVICSHKYSKPPTHRTMEHRRAVLACFLITSIISSNLHRIDSLRWTPHMDDCLQVLDEKKECPNDHILVQQVRLQLITDKAAVLASHSNKVESADQHQPSSQHVGILRPELLKVKTDILQTPQAHESLFLHLSITELNSVMAPLSIYSNQLPSYPVKLLTAGLQAVKSWFDFFFTIPPTEYVGFTFAIYFQLLTCLTTLRRLTHLNATNWDNASIRETADLLPLLDRAIYNLEQVSVSAGLDNSGISGGDLFSRAAEICRSLRSGWEAELVPDFLLSAGETLGDPSVQDILGVEFFDNDWLMDLLIPPHY